MSTKSHYFCDDDNEIFEDCSNTWDDKEGKPCNELTFYIDKNSIRIEDIGADFLSFSFDKDSDVYKYLIEKLRK